MLERWPDLVGIWGAGRLGGWSGGHCPCQGGIHDEVEWEALEWTMDGWMGMWMQAGWGPLSDPAGCFGRDAFVVFSSCSPLLLLAAMRQLSPAFGPGVTLDNCLLGTVDDRMGYYM